MVEKLSDYTYRLRLPKTLKRLHPVFHAVLLEKVKVAKSGADDEFRDRLFLPGDDELPGPIFEEPTVVPASKKARQVPVPATLPAAASYSFGS